MQGLLLTLAVLGVAGSAGAQQDAAKTVPGVTVVRAEGGCPVGFSAEVSARAVMHSADDEMGKDSQRVKLSFVARDGVRIVSAKVTVHGLPVGSRFLPVGDAEGEMTSENFTLRSAAGLSGREVRVPRLAAVKWVEVTEMRYGDGTGWRAGQGEVCRAAPSLFRPVSAVAGR